MATNAEPNIELVPAITIQEGWQILDEEAQRLLHMSAHEFIEKWDAGFWSEPDPDAYPGVMSVGMLLPLVRR